MSFANKKSFSIGSHIRRQNWDGAGNWVSGWTGAKHNFTEIVTEGDYFRVEGTICTTSPSTNFVDSKNSNLQYCTVLAHQGTSSSRALVAGTRKARRFPFTNGRFCNNPVPFKQNYFHNPVNFTQTYLEINFSRHLVYCG